MPPRGIFMRSAASLLPLRAMRLAPAALEPCSWPGNVRELQNVIRRACLLATTPAIGPEPLGLPAVAEQTESAAEPAVDRAAIEQAMQRAAGPSSRFTCHRSGDAHSPELSRVSIRPDTCLSIGRSGHFHLAGP
jgi:DNA-binding NtrC family response regulator